MSVRTYPTSPRVPSSCPSMFTPCARPASVDRGQHAGHVVVHVQQPVRPGPCRQRECGQVHAQGRRAVGDEVAELAGDETADVLLRLLGGPADVRREDHVREAAQGRDELLAPALRLVREHVDRGAGQCPGLDLRDAARRGRRRIRATGSGNRLPGRIRANSSRTEQADVAVPPVRRATSRRPPYSSRSASDPHGRALPSASLSATS